MTSSTIGYADSEIRTTAPSSSATSPAPSASGRVVATRGGPRSASLWATDGLHVSLPGLAATVRARAGSPQTAQKGSPMDENVQVTISIKIGEDEETFVVSGNGSDPNRVADGLLNAADGTAQKWLNERIRDADYPRLAGRRDGMGYRPART